MVKNANFAKFKDPILVQHGSKEAAQEGSKIDQQSVKNGSFSNSFLDPSWEASGTPKTIKKRRQHGPKSAPSSDVFRLLLAW